MGYDELGHFESVLAVLEKELGGIQKQRAELDSKELELNMMIPALKHRIEGMKGIPAQEIDKQLMVTPQTQIPSRPTQLTIGDMCEGFLREAGKPLHGKVLLEKLHQNGRETTDKSLSGALPQDRKGRFENLGENTWALTEWSEDIKAPYRINKDDFLG